MMRSKYAHLSKNVLLFALSGFLPKLLSFVLIPLYTSRLTTAEYGKYDLMLTTVQLLLPIFTLGIQDAALRFSLDSRYDSAQVFTVALKCSLLGTLVVTVGAWMGYRFGFFESPSVFVFTALTFGVNAVNNVCTLFCRGIGKTWAIVWGSVVNSAVTLGACILFLLVFDWGLNGYFAANVLGGAASVGVLFFGAELWRYVTGRTGKRLFKDMVSFSFPLIFSGIAWWVNNASDRYVLAELLGVAASGLYAVAYKIPNLLSVFQNVFAQAWSISAVKEFDREDRDGFIGTTYELMQFAMLALCSLLIVLNVPLAKLLYAGEFFGAWQYVPCLLLAVVFHAMSLFIGSIFTAVRDTKTLAFSTVLGAAVNVVGNLAFIPLWGGFGAAVATALGYGVTFSMRRGILRRHIRLRVTMGRNILAYLLVVMQISLSPLEGWGIFWQAVLFVGILWLYKKEFVFVLSKGKMILSDLVRSRKRLPAMGAEGEVERE